MREFFLDEVSGIPFRLFDFTHFFITFLTVVAIILVIWNRKRIFELKTRTKDILRVSIAIFMFLNMAIYYNGYAYYGIYDVRVHLPLHLCFIAGFCFMFALLTGSNKVFRFSYFLSFVGPVPAMIWPDVVSVDSFLFFQYIISHHFFIVASLFIYYAYDIPITKKDMWKTFFITNGVFLFMICINAIFGTNYIMSSSLPEHILNLYPFLRSINYPIIILEVVGVIGMYISYIPVYFHNKEKGMLKEEKKNLKLRKN